MFPTDEEPHEGDVVAREHLAKPRGAYVMGRNMFGPVRGEWATWDGEWRGWWGDEPPYHAPVFVLTHHEHEPVEMEGGTTFHFVTDGFDTAYARAVEAAGDDGEVLIAGGASTIRQAFVGRGPRRDRPRRRRPSCWAAASDSSTASRTPA